MVATQSGLESIKTAQNFAVFDPLWNLGGRSVRCLNGKQNSERNTIEWHKNGKNPSSEYGYTKIKIHNISSAKQTAFRLRREAEQRRKMC